MVVVKQSLVQTMVVFVLALPLMGQPAGRLIRQWLCYDDTIRCQ